jgi:hypothetical protein
MIGAMEPHEMRRLSGLEHGEELPEFACSDLPWWIETRFVSSDQTSPTAQLNRAASERQRERRSAFKLLLGHSGRGFL